MGSWEHFDHDADIGIVGRGSTLAEAFEQAALGLSAIITDAPIHPTIEVTIDCSAPDAELLLVDWLNALVYEMATRGMLFGAFSVEITKDHTLHAIASGEPVDRARHRPVVEVKGATLTGVSVSQEAGGGWRARCVVDV